MPSSIVRTLVLAVFLLYLSGCGWHLKGWDKQNISLEQIHLITTDRYSDITMVIQRELERYGIQQNNNASFTVTIKPEQLNRRTVSVNRAAIAAEYALSLTLPYSLSLANATTQAGQLKTQRIYDFTAEDVVSKAEEEKRLLQDMREELAQNLLRLANAFYKTHSNKNIKTP